MCNTWSIVEPLRSGLSETSETDLWIVTQSFRWWASITVSHTRCTGASISICAWTVLMSPRTLTTGPASRAGPCAPALLAGALRGAPPGGAVRGWVGLMKAAEFAPALAPVAKVPAVCRYFAGCELPAISGIRRCTRGEKSALMLADEVELLGGRTGVTNSR